MPHMLPLFFEMGAGREWREGIPSTVSWSEIAAWLGLTGNLITRSELTILRAMDAAWCSAVATEVSEIRAREAS